jgi:hypothetical protein
MNVGKVGYGTFDRYYGIRRAKLRMSGSEEIGRKE